MTDGAKAKAVCAFKAWDLIDKTDRSPFLVAPAQEGLARALAAALPAPDRDLLLSDRAQHRPCPRTPAVAICEHSANPDPA